MDNRQKILNLVGLATKAGKTASGEFSTEKAVKSGKAHLVIVSEEASDNTKKMFTNNLCFSHPIFLSIRNRKMFCKKMTELKP